MTTEDTYRKAIETYGAYAQTVVAVEELSELQKELCKAIRPGIGDPENRDHIISDGGLGFLARSEGFHAPFGGSVSFYADHEAHILREEYLLYRAEGYAFLVFVIADEVDVIADADGEIYCHFAFSSSLFFSLSIFFAFHKSTVSRS